MEELTSISRKIDIVFNDLVLKIENNIGAPDIEEKIESINISVDMLAENILDQIRAATHYYSK